MRMGSYRKSETIITPTLRSHEMGFGVLKKKKLNFILKVFFDFYVMILGVQKKRFPAVYYLLGRTE